MTDSEADAVTRAVEGSERRLTELLGRTEERLTSRMRDGETAHDELRERVTRLEEGGASAAAQLTKIATMLEERAAEPAAPTGRLATSGNSSIGKGIADSWLTKLIALATVIGAILAAVANIVHPPT